jgi:hypothetical protein
MHRGTEQHDHSGQGGGAIARAPRFAGAGHNHAAEPKPVAQWQTPHLDSARAADVPPVHEPDLDLVEIAFVEAFSITVDPTSFLRLAQVPFEMTAADGRSLVLLRVEVEAVTDVGSMMPHMGGSSFRYDPLPASLVERRRKLRFVYADGQGLRALNFAEVRALVQA